MSYFVVMSYMCPRVTFLPGSKMTLFTFYNYFYLPVKPMYSFWNSLLRLLMCFLNFVFSLNLKWHCLHFYKYLDLLFKPLASFSIFGLILILLSFLMCVLKFLLFESKMFTFYNYYDLPLKQVQLDLPLKLSRRIDCGGTSRKVSSFYVCT